MHFPNDEINLNLKMPVKFYFAYHRQELELNLTYLAVSASKMIDVKKIHCYPPVISLLLWYKRRSVREHSKQLFGVTHVSVE